MDLILKVEGNEFVVSADIIQGDWFANASGNSDYEKMLYSFINSPDTAIRKRIASLEAIDLPMVNTLLQDEQVSVLKELVSNVLANEFMSEPEVVRLINIGDSELCCKIAENIESFELCNENALAKILAKNVDPQVRLALASNYLASEDVIETLVNDKDFAVRKQAKETLEEF